MTCKGTQIWLKKMDASIKRRIDVATYWATNRVSFLDNFENYEDSYALTQEFKEWILCLHQNPEKLEESILKFPNSLIESRVEKAIDSDELLEL
tara:strand:+ start:16702 stop:16983 length:282 start_codon:yes stop_codon:yes gene_type:complete